jgi:16S rRNA (guanine(527)-N(7))-methyltransferase RsmG
VKRDTERLHRHYQKPGTILPQGSLPPFTIAPRNGGTHVDHVQEVSRETTERLRGYLSLLRRWNRRINLIADAPEDVQWQRHVLDSLQLAPLAASAPPGPLIDLGSGGGLPGLVLAIATGRDTHLVESDRRKAAFLTDTAAQLGLGQIRVHAARIDAASLPLAAILTARALAPLADLLPYAHRLLAPDGVALFPKGRTAENELTAAAPTWTMQVERVSSRTDPSATILCLREIRPARASA